VIPKVLLRMGFKFYTRSLLITPSIGAKADIIGTKTPIIRPPIIDAKVGGISYLYPKKSWKTYATLIKETYAMGYAIKLASRTYFKELVRRLITINALSAPITFNNAKSKFFLYTPIDSILFIIITLKVNKDTIISFKVTPINIPT